MPAPDPEDTAPVEMIKLMTATDEQIAQRPVPTRRRRKVTPLEVPTDEPEPDWMIKGRERSEARARERMQAS